MNLTELCSSVATFNAIHHEWANSPNDPNPTIKYWAAYERMVTAFDGDIPAKARSLAEAVYRLAKQYVEFVKLDIPHPPNEFFAAREAMEKVLSTIGAAQETKRPESVIELNRQNVPHQQIAKIWGLVNPDGTGKGWLIQQELDKPGSIIGPDYVHPDDLQLDKTASAAKHEYERVAREADVVTVQKRQDQERPCPETPRELWSQDVSPQQAAKMLKIPEDDVRTLWATWTAEKFPATTIQTPTPPTPISAVKPVTEPIAVTAPINVAVNSEDTASETDDPTDDPYDDFAEWTDDHIRHHAKELGIETRGRFVRNSMIDKIIAAEQDGAVIPGEEEEGVRDEQTENVT